MRILWTQLAIRDIGNVYTYIAEESPSAAARVVERLRKSAAMLLLHPELGRTGRVDGTRELVVSGTPFIISYRVKAAVLEILAVIHGSRRWPDDH